jgi:Ca2+-binding EF-hand superfamily protein
MSGTYERFFKEADKDGSGYLTLAELTNMLRMKGYKDSDDKIKSMFRAVDVSGDQKISLEEYLTAMGEMPPKNHKEASMRNIFRAFDKDDSGTIDRAELTAALKESGAEISPAEIDRIIAMVDKDGSGTLDYEEFIAQVFGK